MKYSNAGGILPEEVLAIVQQYVQGELLYIPKPRETHKKWGENTHGKAMTQRRNREIREAHQAGQSIEQLSERHHLSIESIRKIVYRKP